MKKLLHLSLIMILMTIMIACDSTLDPKLPTDPSIKEVEPIKDIDHNKNRIPLPSDHVLDDFSEGLDPDKWLISTRNWSPQVSQGQKAENVHVTKDGFLVLEAHGMHHQDPDKRLTGSAILTTDTYGAGKYEIAMKVLPRLGVVTAFWTFYYENTTYNHEIDIEFPGNKSLRNVLNTNWTGVNSENYHTEVIETLTPANDGLWHKYTFEWHTDPAVVRYFVDDVLTAEIYDHVPFAKGQIWVGAWFANQWAGIPNFETDYLLVDWISYEPYDQPTIDTEPDVRNVASINQYPVITDDVPSRNYISNGSFENNTTAWTVEGNAYVVSYQEELEKHRIAIDQSGYISQEISAVYDKFMFDIEFKSSILRGEQGKLIITMKDELNQVLNDGVIEFNITNIDEMRNVFSFITKDGTDKIEIKFESVEDTLIFIDDIILKLKIE